MRRPASLLAAVAAASLLSGCFASKQNADDYVQRAKSYEDAGDIAKASAELRTALKISPLHARANAMLAKIEDDQGELQAAVNHYIVAARADAGLLQPQLRLIELMVDTGHLQEALAKANFTLGAFPNNIDAMALRADIEQRQGSAMAAQTDTAAVLAKDPTNARALAVSAMTRMAAGDATGAMDATARGLAKHPENIRLLEVRAAILLSQNNPEKAADTLRTIVRAEPGNVIAQSALAAAEADAGRFDEALAGFQTAAAAEPNNQGLQMALIAFLTERSKPADVVTQFQNLIARNPNASTYDRALAEFYRRRDELPNAEQTLQAAIKRLGNSPAGLQAKIALAKAAILGERYQAAKQDIDEVLAADPNNTDAMLTSAILADKNGRTANTIAILLDLVKRDPVNGQAFQLLASSYMTAGQPALAVDAMQRAASVMPGDIGLQLRLASMLQGAGRRDAQNEILSRLTLQAPNLAAPWFAMGELAIRNNDLATADRALGRLKLLPNASVAAARLAGDMRSSRGDYAASVKLYQDAIQTSAQPDAGLLSAFASAAGRVGTQGDAAKFLETRAADQKAASVDLWMIAMDLWSQAGNAGKADDAFKKAVAAASNPIVPYEVYVADLVQAKSFDRARAVVQAGAAKDLPPWSVQMLEGTIAERQGDLPAALANYNKASDLNPSDTAAANNYASLLADLRPKDKPALEAARARLSGLEASNNASFVDTVAWLDFRLGRLEEAKALLTRIKAGESPNPQIRFHMAAVLLTSGDRGAGLALLDTLKGLSFPGSDEIRDLSAT